MSDDPPHRDDPRTVFIPRASEGAPREFSVEQSQAQTVFPGEPTASSPPLNAPPVLDQPELRTDGRIKVGDILNHIYEVRRFIARGGMGEVYEGVNVNNPVERVAIKVVLPALASDPNVMAMFRKEATTLIRLSHPALVQYRLLAQEPQLGVLYIVTDYIEGANLADVIKTVPRDAASLSGLMRRLAEGLRAAHELGAIHRDVSPDNVILEQGELERARIIDFGIAKDLDPSKKSIIGDGFAGKLGFVAPEQLGDFDRLVGSWSDVYSLALVIMAVASRGEIDMGATLVQAVDKRRAGVDVSAAPEPLQPILTAMLQPDPQRRIRSMAEVVAELSNLSGTTLIPTPPALAQASAPGIFAGRRLRPQASSKPEQTEPGPLQRLMVLPRAVLGGAIAAAIALAGLGYWATHRALEKPKTPVSVSLSTASAAGSPEESARSVLAQTLPIVPCSWLDIEKFESGEGGLRVAFKGVAGNTVTAQSAISDALTKADVKLASVSFEDVSSVRPNVCTLLDGYRQVKSPPPGDLSTDQLKYEMEIQTAGREAGKSAAVPQIHIAAEAMAGELLLGGIDPDGSAASIADAAGLRSALATTSDNGGLNPDHSATLKVNQTAQGLVGIVLIHGKTAIDVQTVFPAGSVHDEAWKTRFVAVARKKGWNADMVWFKIVNEVPDTAPVAAPTPAASPAASLPTNH